MAEEGVNGVEAVPSEHAVDRWGRFWAALRPVRDALATMVALYDELAPRAVGDREQTIH